VHEKGSQDSLNRNLKRVNVQKLAKCADKFFHLGIARHALSVAGMAALKHQRSRKLRHATDTEYFGVSRVYKSVSLIESANFEVLALQFKSLICKIEHAVGLHPVIYLSLFFLPKSLYQLIFRPDISQT
jgi:hypothetical protein